ncbi:hypothetical protein [uncultured Arcticibacterium sp.]|uniref:hypothetical protein n=1 Tax=uncultured Arcticibacterium sp. TaxID=2173042 RepID=UPI0030F6C968
MKAFRLFLILGFTLIVGDVLCQSYVGFGALAYDTKSDAGFQYYNINVFTEVIPFKSKPRHCLGFMYNFKQHNYFGSIRYDKSYSVFTNYDLISKEKFILYLGIGLNISTSTYQETNTEAVNYVKYMRKQIGIKQRLYKKLCLNFEISNYNKNKLFMPTIGLGYRLK